MKGNSYDYQSHLSTIYIDTYSVYIYNMYFEINSNPITAGCYCQLTHQQSAAQHSTARRNLNNDWKTWKPYWPFIFIITYIVDLKTKISFKLIQDVKQLNNKTNSTKDISKLLVKLSIGIHHLRKHQQGY